MKYEVARRTPLIIILRLSSHVISFLETCISFMRRKGGEWIRGMLEAGGGGVIGEARGERGGKGEEGKRETMREINRQI